MAEVNDDKGGAQPGPQKQQNGIRKLLGKVWDEMAPMVSHGSSEVAAALFTGSAFVMYPRSAQEPEVASMDTVSMDTLKAEGEVIAKEQQQEGKSKGKER